MRIYFDTNVFVVAIEQSGVVNELIDEILRRGESRPGLLVTSELTLAELLVKPFQIQREENIAVFSGERAEDYSRIFLAPNTLAAIYAELVEQRPGLNVVPVDRSILILSAFHRADDRALKLPDAIHLAAAEQTACTHIISADRGLRPSRYYEFERVELEQNPLNKVLARIQ